MISPSLTGHSLHRPTRPLPSRYYFDEQAAGTSFDLVIAAVGVVDLLLPYIAGTACREYAVLSLIRALRCFRVVRLIEQYKEAQMVRRCWVGRGGGGVTGRVKRESAVTAAPPRSRSSTPRAPQ